MVINYIQRVAIIGCIYLGALQAVQADSTFVHPGTLNSKINLDFVKEKIAARQQPWMAEFEAIKNSAYATRLPHAVKYINEGTAGVTAMREDVLAAYSQALLWYVTGDEVYALRAISIINAWSSFQGFNLGTDQDKLRAGWIAIPFASAADIMLGYPGWNTKDIAQTKAMFSRTFYPHLKVASHWNGNVDLTQIAGLMSIAVFNEDGNAFQLGLNRIAIRTPAYFYLTTDGILPNAINGDDLNTFWFKPAQWVDGLTQETCRDNGHHTQFGLGSAIQVAEIAWNQGVDIYSQYAKRYIAAMELHAAQLLDGKVETCADTTPSKTRLNTWEVGYNHYHGRKGLRLPNTQRLIEEQVRPFSERTAWNINYETLTHGFYK